MLLVVLISDIVKITAILEFGINDKDFIKILSDCINAGNQWKNIALSFGIKTNEINLFKQNFKHKDIEKSIEILKKHNAFKKSHAINPKPKQLNNKDIEI